MSKLEIKSLPYDVNKANELIRNKVTINNLLAGRIFANFVSLIKPDDSHFYEYEIPVIEIARGEHGGANYKQIKDALFNLAEKCNFERKLEGKSYQIIPVFSLIEYDDNNQKIRCSFNDRMKPYLLELKANYTKYNLMEFLLLPSLYSQKLFELLKSWEKLGETILSIEELYRILDVPESYTYKDFKRRILEKAKIDIHTKTSLKYEYEPLKKGRSFTHIRFIFNKKMIAEKKEKDTVAQSNKNNGYYKRAVACAKEKKGICAKKNQIKSVCSLCEKFNFKEKMEAQEKQGKLI